MNQRYFEDVKVGDCFGSNSYKVSETQICAFAEEFDPQAFHLDAEAARKSIFQQLSASGWHTAAIAMRLFVTGELQFSGGAIGLGVDELRWPHPLQAGDVVRLETEIIETRGSKSKPGYGIVRMRNVATNQRGAAVITYIATALVLRQPG